MIDKPSSLSARLIAASPLSMSIADVQAQTQERRRALLAAPPIPEPDIAPEPAPTIIQDPVQFAREYWSGAGKPKVARITIQAETCRTSARAVPGYFRRPRCG